MNQATRGAMAFVVVKLLDLRSKGGPRPYWTVMNEVDGRDFRRDHRFLTEAEAVQMAKSLNAATASEIELPGTSPRP